MVTVGHRRRPGRCAGAALVLSACPAVAHPAPLPAALPSCRYAGGPTGYTGPTTACVETNVSIPEAYPGEEISYDNTARVYSGG